MTEFSAALSLKVRTGCLTPAQRADVLAVLTSLTVESFTVLPLSRVDFHTAARFADQYETGLRAGDALHLAVVAHHGARLYSLDRGLLLAAEALGVSCGSL